MAEEKKIETSVDELVEDLKVKIDTITKAGQGFDGQEKQAASQIVDKAVAILTNASNKIVETAKKFPESPEVLKGVEIVKAKSKELYENALIKLEDIKKSNIVEETAENIKKTVEEIQNNETVQNVVETISQTAETVKQNVSEAVNVASQTITENVSEILEKPEVKETLQKANEAVEKAKIATVDLADKALATLKEWFQPEDND